MRSAKPSHPAPEAGARRANASQAARISARNAASPEGRLANPSIRVSGGRIPSACRSYNAGNIFRRERSPEAPNTTIQAASGRPESDSSEQAGQEPGSKFAKDILFNPRAPVSFRDTSENTAPRRR